MTEKRTAAIAVALGLALTGAAGAAPQGPSGDWVGTLNGPRQLKIGMHVRPAAGGYAGSYAAVTQEYQDMPMTPVREAGVPGFRLTSPVGVFIARWDAASGAWRAAWTIRGKVSAVAFHRGPIPQPPLVSAEDRIMIEGTVAVMALEAGAIAWLLHLRRRRRRRVAAAAAA